MGPGGPVQVGQQNWRNVGTTFGPAYVKQEQSEATSVSTLQQKQAMGTGHAPARDELLGKLTPQRIGPGSSTGLIGPPGQVSGAGHQMSHAEPNMLVCRPFLSDAVRFCWKKREALLSFNVVPVQCMSGHIVNRKKIR
jgi:hypothetical protein